MVTVSVVYPASSRFDHDHYLAVHVPLVGEHWSAHGFQGATVLRGVQAPDGGPPPYSLIALLEFDSIDSVNAALASAGTPAILGDIANFTDAAPVIQVNERA